MIPGLLDSPWAFALAAAGLSLLAAEAWRRLALRRQLLDQPEARRLHTTPTPRGGGVGIALVLLACSPWLGEGAGAFALGLAITAGGGLADDLRPLGALPKLLLQAAGALPPALAWPLLPELLGPVLAVVAAWLLVLSLVNAWNFMDGSNGMAASQGLLFGAGLLLIAGLASPAGWLGLALVAACLGFLPLNLPRARLFLGDVGAYTLGYAAAALLLAASATGVASAWCMLLLSSALLLDTGLTLLGRLRRRRKPWQAHRDHLYQRAVAHGWSHGGICAGYAVWTMLAGALAVAVADAPVLRQLAALAGACGLGVLVYALAGRSWPLPLEGSTLESVG